MDTLPKTTKMTGFDTPTVWYKYNRLATLTNSVNLGQGFADWYPPQFFIDALKKNVSNPAIHQYTRSFGNLKLVNAIAKTYGPYFNRELDPLSEVLVTSGATNAIYCAITVFVNPGDEVIAIEPFYDCYLPMVTASSGKLVGVPMIPPKPRDKSEYEQLDPTGETPTLIRDKWELDFEKLRAALNEKTKMIILNTPNNPTGKVLSYEELNQIAELLKDFPNVILLMDEVYEYMLYEDYDILPRMATLPGMWDRTLSVMSAGKIFSATGLRMGWIIGPKALMKNVNALFQYSTFCLNDPYMISIAECLEISDQPYEGFDTYYKWLKNHYLKSRNYFLSNLAKMKKFDVNFYLPEGGYFLVSDISQKKNEPKYKFEGEENMDVNYRKDYNFTMNIAQEWKVIMIPLSPFYTDENKSIGENFIRLAFCKKKETMDKAFANLELMD